MKPIKGRLTPFFLGRFNRNGSIKSRKKPDFAKTTIPKVDPSIGRNVRLRFKEGGGCIVSSRDYLERANHRGV